MEKKIKAAYQVKINIPGGAIGTGDFSPLITALQDAGVAYLRIGMRQQLLFTVDEQQLDLLQYTVANDDWTLEVNDDQYPNIVSSYVSDEIFNKADWLREGVYKDILDGFDHKPRLKVNLSDAAQSFVPHYSGHLNFISSPISQHWYLCIRFPKTNLRYNWSTLFYSYDIPQVCRVLETILLTSDRPYIGFDPQEAGRLLEKEVQSRQLFSTQEYEQPFVPARFLLPYYEGFNPYQNKYWLGIYRRNGQYTLPFLQDISKACLTSGITQIHSSPWRSLIIKQIAPADRTIWDRVMDKHRISLRHASSELNWQLEDHSSEAIALKQDIIRYFNEQDTRTYKLCFGIKTTAQSGVWGSILLRPTEQDISGERRYDLTHTLDFNPHSSEEIIFRQSVARADLGPALAELCNCYYEQQLSKPNDHGAHREATTQTTIDSLIADPLYQCPDCLSLYDPRYGDDTVTPGTPFSDLPDSYTCFICGTAKEHFTLLPKRQEVAHRHP